MLTIRDTEGSNLVDNPPETAIYQVTDNIGAPVTITGEIVETADCLPFAWVGGTLDWADGSPLVVFDRAAGTLPVNVVRTLAPGDYNVMLTGVNYRLPAAETVSVNFRVIVQRVGLPAAPPNLIFGPILPRDSGDPNLNSWNFNTDSDLLILESSVKMLLLTGKGERVMEPDYGTNIRRIVFEMNNNAVDALVESEIKEALTRWEPRVRLSELSIQRDRTTVNVRAAFLSVQAAKNFELNLRYVK